MRKLMVLAAMLAMMMVATAPAMAQTTDHDDGDLVDYPACFPFCEDNSFEDGFLLISLDEGVFDDVDSDDINSDDIDSDDNDIDIDIDFDSDDNDSDIDFDDNDSDDNDSDRNNNDGNNNRSNSGGNGGRN
jgi:hypothetical protein